MTGPDSLSGHKKALSYYVGITTVALHLHPWLAAKKQWTISGTAEARSMYELLLAEEYGCLLMCHTLRSGVTQKRPRSVGGFSPYEMLHFSLFTYLLVVFSPVYPFTDAFGLSLVHPGKEGKLCRPGHVHICKGPTK